MTEVEKLCQRLEKTARPPPDAQDLIDAAHKIRELVAQLEAARLEARRYQVVRAGHVHIETGDFYAVIGYGRGKHYSDMRDFDMDLDHFSSMAKEGTA